MLAHASRPRCPPLVALDMVDASCMNVVSQSHAPLLSIASLPAPSVALIVLDGWGNAPPGPGTRSTWRDPHLRPVSRGATPHDARRSGRAVGLPDGLMGNSEVGHLNLGAGGRRPGPHADRRGGRRRLVLRQPALKAVCEAARRARAGAAPDGPRLRRRRPLHGSTSRRARAGRRARASRPRRARVHRRPRHAAASAPGYVARARALAAPRRGHR